MRSRLVLFSALLLAAACSTLPEGQRATDPATGPPRIDPATVARHALQLDEEEPDRPAGSQQELALSAYIVAHLTEAGYVSRLDAVPVRDLVRSTNVVGLPPGGDEPEVLVVTGYDGATGKPPAGEAVGLWLELARALRVVEPDHRVQFVALGAELSEVAGGNLGSRRLAQQLADEGATPEVVVLASIGEGDLGVGGHARAALRDVARTEGLEEGPARPSVAATVFERAGLDTTVVSGPAEDAGALLLAYLSGF